VMFGLVFRPTQPGLRQAEVKVDFGCGGTPDYSATGFVVQGNGTCAGPPQITCPVNVTVTATSAGGAAVSYPAPTVTNPCGTVMVACSPASGSTFPVGNTTVICTATDGLGEVNSCQFNVSVLPIADLALAQTASASSVKSGSNLTYTLLLKNSGP